MHHLPPSLPKALAKLVAALCLSGLSLQAQPIDVPANVSIGAPVDYPGGGLKGEYWQRGIKSIFTDGRDNPAHRIDVQINGFGPPSGTFKATQFEYTGNDLTPVRDWLGSDAASFVGSGVNLDDGAFRFTGFINIAAAGILNIGTRSDDGSRIKIGGVDVINNDNGHGDETRDQDVNFQAAGLYPIEITYFNGDWTSDNGVDHGGANFRLRMNGGDNEANVTPAQVAMFHPVAQLPAKIWSIGRDDNGWPLGDGGEANTSFVQENGIINPLPGSPVSTEVPRGADNDYYLAGSYNTVIAGNGAYTPVGVVPVNEEAAERAFAAADNDLRYHFNLPALLNPLQLLSVTFDANNLHEGQADSRYGVEVYVNGVKVQDEIVIRPAQLNTAFTTPPFSLASVNAQVGPGYDNIVSLRGVNYNADGGGNWMGIDYVQLNVENRNPDEAGLVKGYLEKLRFDNIGNSTALADLLNNPKYINNQPDFTCLRSDFSANDANECDNCGLVVRGFFTPTASGPHTFYISADDGAGLFLSTDENPANKVLIAREPAWTGRRNYIGGDGDGNGTGRGDPPVNISAPINLVAGNHYYIEGAVKEGGGGDNLDVAVQGPGDPPVQDGDRPIFGDRISTRIDVTGSRLAVTQNPANTRVPEGDVATFTVAADAFSPLCGGLTTYQWQRNGVNIPGANSATYSFGPVRVEDHLATYRVVVAIPGLTRTSSSATLEVLGRECLRVAGVIGSGDLTHATVQFSTFINLTDPSTVDPFSYSIVGLTIQSVALGDDGKSVILTTEPQAENTEYVVSVTGVQSLVGSATCEAPNNQGTFRSWVTGPCNGVLFQSFLNIPGNLANNLVNHPSFPNSPSETFTIGGFNSRLAYADDSHEQYGARMRGLFIPPTSGNWVFYMAADDGSRLLFNPTGPNAATTQVLLNRDACCGNYGSGNSKSAPQALVAGQGYYIEVLYKEGGGGDWAQVAARLEGQPTPPMTEWIPGSQLGFPAAPAGIGGVLAITEQPASIAVVQNSTATFSVGLSNPNSLPVCSQWFRDGVAIDGATGLSYSLLLASLADSGARFTVQASIIGSPVILSQEAILTVNPDVTPPACVSASGTLNLSNIVVRFDELLSAGSAGDVFNYSMPGFGFVSAILQPDGKSVLLQVDPALTPDTAYTVSIQNLADLAGNPQPSACSLSFRSFAESCGVVLQELYFGIGGVSIADLRSNPAYPNSPSLVRYKGSLQANTGDEFDNYGTRMSGWLVPPVSGNYNFFMSSDDGGELWLSTDASPANLVQIASEPVWNGRREWTTLDRRNAAAPENRSSTLFPAGIPLVAGQKYYFEALMKEGGGGDNLAVTWQLPGAPLPRPGSPEIPGAYICSLANPAGASVTIAQQPGSQCVEEDTVATFTVGATALVGGQPAQNVFYQWYSMTPGGSWAPVLGATGATYAPTAKLSDNGNKYRVVISVPGASATSEEVTLSVYHRNTPPKFTCGPNQGVNEDDGAQTIAAWATGIQNHSIARTPIVYANDFSAGLAGMQVFGIAAVADGVLKLTTPLNGAYGAASISSPLRNYESLEVSWKSLVGGGANGGADGYSLSIGTDVPADPGYGGEEGIGTGLTVTVDTFDNGTGEDVGVDIKWGGTRVAYVNIPKDDDGSGNYIRKNTFVDANLQLSAAGVATLTYDGNTISATIPGYTGLQATRALFWARTGGANDNQWVDDFRFTGFTYDKSSVEGGQTVQFTASNDNPSLFSAQPTVSPNGTLTYTPAPNACGSAVVTVVAQDDGGSATCGLPGNDTSAPCTFTINIACANDCPTAAGQTLAVDAGSSVSFQLTGGDIDGDALAYAIAQPPAHGIVVLQTQTGAGTYTPTAGYSGPDSFTFQTGDASCSSAPALVTINVRLSNTAPTAKIVATPLVDFSPEIPNKLLISCNGSNACLTLDGSTSFDAESPASDLTYAWYLTPSPLPFATGAIVEHCLELGTQTITLAVKDPQGAEGTTSLTIEVLSAGEAMDELITKINDSTVARKNKRPFIATLKAAAASAERGQTETAANQLNALKNKIQAQVSRENPADAAVWTSWTQSIIDALNGCGE